MSLFNKVRVIAKLIPLLGLIAMSCEANSSDSSIANAKVSDMNAILVDPTAGIRSMSKRGKYHDLEIGSAKGTLKFSFGPNGFFAVRYESPNGHWSQRSDQASEDLRSIGEYLKSNSTLERTQSLRRNALLKIHSSLARPISGVSGNGNAKPQVSFKFFNDFDEYTLKGIGLMNGSGQFIDPGPTSDMVGAPTAEEPLRYRWRTTLELLGLELSQQVRIASFLITNSDGREVVTFSMKGIRDWELEFGFEGDQMIRMKVWIGGIVKEDLYPEFSQDPVQARALMDEIRQNLIQILRHYSTISRQTTLEGSANALELGCGLVLDPKVSEDRRAGD